MANFKREFVEQFLGAVRKYMQMRGNLSQKDLAELTEVGVSSMSRFLNQKNRELDAQMIAKIVARLEIPLHEVIDFVEEDSTEKFKKMVAFYKETKVTPPPPGGHESTQGDPFEDALSGSMGGTAKQDVRATVNIGGRKTTIPFSAEGGDSGVRPFTDMSIREKLELLSPRQKAYLKDFLDLDGESKDLMVDLGNSLFRYFKQKGLEF